MFDRTRLMELIDDSFEMLFRPHKHKPQMIWTKRMSYYGRASRSFTQFARWRRSSAKWRALRSLRCRNP